MAQTTYHCPKCGTEISAEISDSPFAACPVCGNCSLIHAPGVKPGAIIDGFQVISFLGAGGMGEVWLAEQLSMNRKVALKILSPSLTNEPEFIDRFKHEIRMAGMLEHPNIATAFHAGRSGGIHYLAISYIEGMELSEKRRRESILSEREALQIAMSVALALKFAWDRYRMLHRDIKPSNIMIETDGTVKIMDLGLSKCVSEKLRLTMTGVTVGTPDYMSPEQALGAANLDCRADIYSLGATLFFITTGRLPFEGDSPLEIATKHITEDLTPPKELNPKLSDAFSELIRIMMSKDMDDRQSNWDNVIMDLERVSSGYPPSGHRPEHAVTVQMKNSAEKLHAIISTEKIPVAQKAPSGKKTLFFIAASLLAVLLVVAIGITALLKEQKRPSQPLRQEIKETAKTKQEVKTENDKKNWLKAMAEYKKNPDDYSRAALIFEKLKNSVSNEKYRLMADKQIESIRKDKDNAIKSTIKKLKEKALKLFSENKFEEAVSAYTDYNGPLADETLETRKELAKACVKKYQALMNKQMMEKQEKERAAEKLQLKAATETLRGNFSKAHETLSTSKENCKEFESILRELSDTDKLILKNFSAKTGKKIEIKTKTGVIKGKLKKINGSTICLEKRIGKALLTKKVAFKNLSTQEKRKRLSTLLMPEAFSVYSAVEDIKNLEFKSADAALKKTGSLSGLFRKALLFMQPEKLSEFMQKEYEEIQTDASLSGESDREKERILIKIKHFRKKYALAEDFNLYDKRLLDVENGMKQNQKDKTEAPKTEAAFSSPDISPELLNEKLQKKNKNYKGKAKFQFQGEEITEADLSKCRNVFDISPLKGLKLKKLYLPDSVSDLTPLKGMPLGNLRSESRTLSNLEVLQDMPLIELYIKAELSNISYLKGLKLQYLYLANSRVTDLTPLERMPLTHLYLPDSVSDLTPLKDMPLQELFLPHSKVKDISPLEGMPLERLDLMNTRITDLSPLSGMSHLQELNLFGCTKLKNLEPLMKCENLRKLVLPTTLSDESDFLRKHPGIKFLGTTWPPGPAVEFWKHHK